MRAQRRRLKIAMTASERDAFLAVERVCRIATVGPNGAPDVTPLWFAWHDGRLWFSSVIRSQRWTNLMRQPRVAIVVDSGHGYEQLRGVEIHGIATPVGEQPRSGADVPELVGVERLYGRKYGIDRVRMYDGLHAWVRVDVSREMSWDHGKIAAASAG